MIWEKALGALLVLPLCQKRSCKHSLKDDSNLNNDCEMQSLRFQTFSALGSCSCSALAHVATTCCELFLLPNQRHMRQGTTLECSKPWWLCWHWLPSADHHGTQSGILAHEIGRFRLAFGKATRTSCVLGFTVRCNAHVAGAGA